jgi:ribosomal protein L11 methyltransferase
VIVPDSCDRNAIAALFDRERSDNSSLSFEPLAQQDWVATSLIGLKPVRAGRFLIHGSHDRVRVPKNAIGIEIEAALAFGTGHHGTTRGCLLALDQLLSRRVRPRCILDVGTGTGILAIAAARAAHVPVTATDIDPAACKAARDNARLNRVHGWVVVARAKAKVGGPYNLIMANILARPLIAMSGQIARLLGPSGHLVLSGLLPEHARSVISAYRQHGLSLERRMLVDGWVTLTMYRAV